MGAGRVLSLSALIVVLCLCGEDFHPLVMARTVLGDTDILQDRTDEIMARLRTSMSVDFLESVLVEAREKGDANKNKEENSCAADVDSGEICIAQDQGKRDDRGRTWPSYTMTNSSGVIHHCTVEEGLSGRDAGSRKGVANALDNLNGKCGSLGKNYWKYLWCHRVDVGQYHIGINEGIVRTDVKIGKYKRTEVELVPRPDSHQKRGLSSNQEHYDPSKSKQADGFVEQVAPSAPTDLGDENLPRGSSASMVGSESDDVDESTGGFAMGHDDVVGREGVDSSILNGDDVLPDSELAGLNAESRQHQRGSYNSDEGVDSEFDVRGGVEGGSSVSGDGSSAMIKSDVRGGLNLAKSMKKGNDDDDGDDDEGLAMNGDDGDDDDGDDDDGNDDDGNIKDDSKVDGGDGDGDRGYIGGADYLRFMKLQPLFRQEVLLYKKGANGRWLGLGGGEIVHLTKGGKEIRPNYGKEWSFFRRWKGPENLEDWDDLSRVTAIHDYFEGGDKCKETGGPRKARVSFMCCFNEGRTDTVNLSQSSASIMSVQEVSMCSYQINICTRLMCVPDMEYPGVLGLLGSMDACFPLKKDSWWTYEFCYLKGFRQFHAGPAKREDGENVSAIEVDFSLGKFDPSTLPEREEDLVQEGVDGEQGAIVLEYTGGTECTLTGEKRSTTVYLTCGPTEVIKEVVEDHTCHYRVKATSPLLCRHPALTLPDIPTRAVRCLPETPSLPPWDANPSESE